MTDISSQMFDYLMDLLRSDVQRCQEFRDIVWCTFYSVNRSQQVAKRYFEVVSLEGLSESTAQILEMSSAVLSNHQSLMSWLPKCLELHCLELRLPTHHCNA
ncbi:hypothetical protein D3C76_1337290 [compost metagenome]